MEPSTTHNQPRNYPPPLDTPHRGTPRGESEPEPFTLSEQIGRLLLRIAEQEVTTSGVAHGNGIGNHWL